MTGGLENTVKMMSSISVRKESEKKSGKRNDRDQLQHLGTRDGAIKDGEATV